MERKQYCDYLRVFATFAVVVLHVSATNWYITDVNGMDWQVFNFYDSIVRWGVPIFVMISGSLFLGRDVSLKKIYSKYILRMVVAFVFWSLFYALMTKDTFEKGIFYGLKIHIGAIASGHYHMWFVLMIIGLYMCIPFIKKIVSEERTTKYFLVLSFVFAFFIPWSIRITNDFVAYKSEIVTKIVGVVNSNVSSMSMNMVLGYTFYFVLGYYLDRKEIEKKYRGIIYIIGILGFAFTVVVDLVVALRTKQCCGNYYGYFNVNVLCEAVAIHTLFKYHDYRNERLNRFAVTLSKYGFGAYLIHAFFIEKLSSVLHFNTLSFNAIASVPVISAIVFLLAFCVSTIMNQIPIIKKYIV